MTPRDRRAVFLGAAVVGLAVLVLRLAPAAARAHSGQQRRAGGEAVARGRMRPGGGWSKPKHQHGEADDGRDRERFTIAFGGGSR